MVQAVQFVGVPTQLEHGVWQTAHAPEGVKYVPEGQATGLLLTQAPLAAVVPTGQAKTQVNSVL